jgi:hypothetical protein
MFRVKHSHGIEESFGSYSEAIAAVRSVYGSAVIVDNECDPTRALVWTSEDLARDDDGSRACASIWEMQS